MVHAVVKEREMEIGYPTDVKHVAHVGLDGRSGSAPSWVRSPLLIPYSCLQVSQDGNAQNCLCMCVFCPLILSLGWNFADA